MLPDSLKLPLFQFPLFDTLKSVIHHFQFVKLVDVFQPCYSPLAAPSRLKY